MSDELIAVGRVGAPRGVRGDVFVEPWTDDAEERFAAGTSLRTEPAEFGPLLVEAASSASGKLVVHFSGVADREGAQRLRGARLLVLASQRAPLADPDEFYASDLIGLAVLTTGGEDLGAVRDVLNMAGADYLVVQVAGRERLVPFVSAIVPTVDIAGRRVVIDPPEGLFEI